MEEKISRINFLRIVFALERIFKLYGIILVQLINVVLFSYFQPLYGMFVICLYVRLSACL